MGAYQLVHTHPGNSIKFVTDISEIAYDRGILVAWLVCIMFAQPIFLGMLFHDGIGEWPRKRLWSFKNDQRVSIFTNQTYTFYSALPNTENNHDLLISITEHRKSHVTSVTVC